MGVGQHHYSWKRGYPIGAGLTEGHNIGWRNTLTSLLFPLPSLLLISFINQTQTEARKQGIPRDVIGLALLPRKKAGRDRRVKRREVHMGIIYRLGILAIGPHPIWDPVEKEHNL